MVTGTNEMREGGGGSNGGVWTVGKKGYKRGGAGPTSNLF